MNLSDHPTFLMIGSMKSGTTSIFEDFTRHPGIFCPTIKEPDDLADDKVLTEKGREEYLRIFRDAQPGQWIGEASTAYTQYPTVSGVPRRAKDVLGSDLRLIFVGRNPLDRMKSHYRHDVQKGAVTRPIEDELEANPFLFDVSCYDKQLDQWLAEFPREQILVLHMKDYIQTPKEVVHGIWKFLDLEPVEMEHGVASNVSSGKRAPRGLMRKIVRSRAYGLYAKKFLPSGLRKNLRQIIVPKRDVEFRDDISEESRSSLEAQLKDSTSKFDTWVEEDRKRLGLIS
ncbi:Sulfotransferase domain-containing protein [Palleronia marisminoris]|uniref:Sulfotransferase domain protein n=1 Tax=Palleronia marisminoris TaxID=315423 RepID=A0A1Y5TV24_9RHOB|nr:sulfotransferase domain-containing protein [Palleronia marisminoris]SFH50321.1 Sulfotransferase domain-containing protein [Palleronia marisminoris]SLN70395.1 Sulfotransferase domain protein [Palleronia marisminoris]